VATVGQVLDLFPSGEIQDSDHWAYYFRGVAHYERNELAQAAEDFSRLAGTFQTCHTACWMNGMLGLALAYEGQGAREKADRVMAETLTTLLESHNAGAELVVRMLEAELAWQRRDLDGALLVINRLADADTTSELPPIYFYVPELTVAKAWLAQNTAGSREQARLLLARMHQQFDAAHNRRRLIDVLAMEAWLNDLDGDSGAALEVLAAAIALARPSRIIRAFVDMGPAMSQLLSRLRLQEPDEYVGAILAAFPPDQTRAAPRSLEQRVALDSLLTERESDVLRLLAARMSNKEIATELVLSPKTIKRYTFNIYQKLDVNNRRQAVARASALGILPAPPQPTSLPVLGGRDGQA